jgi:hypothetical protein
MVEVFRTNVPEDGGCAREIVKELSALLPGCRINFDLDDCDRILRIEGDRICSQLIIGWMHSCGYGCSLLD